MSNDTFGNGFRRVLPRRSLGRGHFAVAFLWSAIATLCLACLLLVLYLLADLLVTQGAVVLSTDQMEQVRQWQGQEAPLPVGLAAGPAAEPAGGFELANTGILPSALRSDGAYRPLFEGLYRGVPQLQSNRAALGTLVLAFALLGVLWHVTELAASSASQRAALKASGSLRRAIHRQALRLGAGDLRGRRTAEAVALFTTQVDRVEKAVRTWVFHVVRDPLRLALMLTLALLLDWRLTLLWLVPLGVCYFLLDYENRRGIARQKLASARADAALRMLGEGLQKTRLVAAYQMEDFEHEQFERHLDRFTNEIATGDYDWRWARRFSWIVSALCAAIVLYLLGAKVLFDADGFGLAEGLFLLSLYLVMAVSVKRIGRLFPAHETIRSVGDQIDRYLLRIPEVSQAVGAKFLDPLSEAITFELVTFRNTSGQVLLDRFDLRIEAGTTTAFVSIDPLEAKAAASLLPRFMEPQSGRVLYDGNDTAWATLESIRTETVYVGGRDPFFTGTVAQNIACGERFPLPEVMDAAKMCHAHKFITGLPQGYETLLGEHGERPGPGEAFLIGLARAALRKPAVLIIEEPDEPLSDEIKALLDDTYNRLCRGRTVIFLPHRLSTVRRCDQVVLIHQGKVEAVGPHSDLVKRSELYKHWEYITFNAIRRGQQARQWDAQSSPVAT